MDAHPVTEIDIPGLPPSLHLARQDNIAILRLTRPAKRNAIDNEMILGIDRVFSALPHDIRAVVLHGEGALPILSLVGYAVCRGCFVGGNLFYLG